MAVCPDTGRVLRDYSAGAPTHAAGDAEPLPPGTIFVGRTDYALTAFYKDTNTPAWNVSSGELTISVSDSAAAPPGALLGAPDEAGAPREVAATTDGRVRLFAAEEGDAQWSAALPGGPVVTLHDLASSSKIAKRIE